MIILDTNVLSVVMQVTPDSTVLGWLDRQPRTSIWTTSISTFEVRFGLQIMAHGKRRAELLHKFESFLEKIEHRIAPFDGESASQTADLMALRQKNGRTGDLRDTMIAGIVLANRASLATRNVAHFADISATVVNPWSA
jgi:predicted nucleic acid-binding protein